MASHYIFSACIGTFAFDNEFRIEGFMPAADPRVNSALILAGKVIEEENAFSKKLSGSVIVRADKAVSELPCTTERSIVLKILSIIKGKNLAEFRAANILIVKRTLSKSVSPDLLIMQQINAIGELTKAANLVSKRLREWYELYNPEISKRTEDHALFASIVSGKSKEEILAEISIKKEDSMGADITPEELSAILSLARQLSSLFNEISAQSVMLEEDMRKVCPHVTEAAGFMIGAKLIYLAGGLKNLAQIPSSKIQVLGAEKALFRHLKTGARPPKYGVISQHQAIAAAGKDDKGKAARAVAAKISIAARVDYFRERV
jgi:RNA processing factor Prp31